jgi:hypothetical protein
MMILLLSFLVIGLAVAGLAAGVIMGRKPLQGSCGGLNNFTEGKDCELCGGHREKCAEINGEPE